jgi:hypothetical protein
MLDQDVEVILFGNDEGGAEACAELGLRHMPEVTRTSSGAIRLDDMFGKAQTLARYDLLCYVNCDILLLEDFLVALQQVRIARPRFLMVGRRWDVDITEPIDFSRPNWQEETRHRARETQRQRDAWWIDYFAFPRGLYGTNMPPLAIGRTSWDNWLIWKAVAENKPVIDASRAVLAIHQNHDYSHHPQGTQGVWKGEESKRNFELTGGWSNLRSIADATELLTQKGLKPNPYRHVLALKRDAVSLGRFLHYRAWNPLWFAALDATRPLRTVLGLRSKKPL